MTTTETTPTMPLRVWPGCLSCYNAGQLVGAWIDAADAGELTIERLHELAGAPSGWAARRCSASMEMARGRASTRWA